MFVVSIATLYAGALLLLGVAFYLLRQAHTIRREQDRRVGQVIANAAAERAELLDRLAHKEDKPYNPPPILGDGRIRSDDPYDGLDDIEPDVELPEQTAAYFAGTAADTGGAF